MASELNVTRRLYAEKCLEALNLKTERDQLAAERDALKIEAEAAWRAVTRFCGALEVQAISDYVIAARSAPIATQDNFSASSPEEK